MDCTWLFRPSDQENTLGLSKYFRGAVFRTIRRHADKILCATSRHLVTNHFTTTRRRADTLYNSPLRWQYVPDWQFCTTRPHTDTKHLASRRRDTTSYYTPSGWIIVHRMKLCHPVKWNVTERLILKCDWLAYLYNSVTFQLTFSWVNGTALSCDQIYNKRIVNDAWIILLWFLNSLLDKQN